MGISRERPEVCAGAVLPAVQVVCVRVRRRQAMREEAVLMICALFAIAMIYLAAVAVA